MSPSIGMKVEAWFFHGLPSVPLTRAQRTEIVEFLLEFEECQSTRAELEALDDRGLVSVGYFVMADYTRGQV